MVSIFKRLVYRVWYLHRKLQFRVKELDYFRHFEITIGARIQRCQQMLTIGIVHNFSYNPKNRCNLWCTLSHNMCSRLCYWNINSYNHKFLCNHNSLQYQATLTPSATTIWTTTLHHLQFQQHLKPDLQFQQPHPGIKHNSQMCMQLQVLCQQLSTRTDVNRQPPSLPLYGEPLGIQDENISGTQPFITLEPAMTSTDHNCDTCVHRILKHPTHPFGLPLVQIVFFLHDSTLRYTSVSDIYGYSTDPEKFYMSACTLFATCFERCPATC